VADPDFIPDQQQPQDPDFIPDAPKEPNLSALKSYVGANIKDHFAAGDTEESKLKAQDKKQSAATTAKGFIDALEAGYQGSATGLAIRGKLPDINLPEHAPTAYKIASQIGGLADLPLMAAAGAGGALAGGAAGTAEAPVLGTVSGAAVGGGAAAFAVPAAMRKILVDHYEKGDIMDAHDFATRVASTSWEAIKGATVGAATALTGGATKFAGPLVQGASELAAMTTSAAALEGHLPEPSDFVAGAVVIGGLHGVGVLKPKLSNIYAATGELPSEIAKKAEVDVNLKQDLIAGNLNEPIPPVKIGEDNKSLVSEPVTPKDLQPKTPAILEKDTLPRTEDEKAILSKIGESAEVPGSTLKEKWQDWYQKNIDKNSPLKYAIQEAEARGAEIAPDKDAFQAATRFAAYQDRVGSFYEYGTRDFDTGKVNGEGLNQIYADIPNKDMNGFRAYGMAARGLELHERGIKPWADFDPEQAKRVVDAGADKYEAINQRRVDFKNRVLDYVQKSGLIDEDAKQRMMDANTKAFPFHRVQEPDVFTGSKSGGAILKKIYGSDKLILDPVLSDYQDTALMIKSAMVNDVRNTFYENMKAGNLVDEGEGNPDAYLKKVPVDMKAISVGSDELSAALAKQGIDLKADDINVFRPEHGVLADNQIAFKVDGKRVVYEGPPGVIESLKALDGDGAAMGIWTKFMAGFAKMERIGNTSSPTFGFSHFFRSAAMSGVYSKTGQIPFFDAAKVIPDIINKSELYRDAEYQGAFSKVFEPINNQFMEKSIESAGIETNFAQKAWNVVKHPLDAAEAWIKLTDSASRLAEYKGAIEQGKSPEEAASLARSVVVDYQKVGLEKSAIRQTTAFIGVHINSMDRLRLAFVEDPKSTIARLGVISGISAALWAVNKDDEAINSLPSWQKGLFWNVNLSRATQGAAYNPKDATILRLPKPWAAGIAFGTGVEVALDLAFKHSQSAGSDFAKTLLGSVVPMPIPNMVAPMIDQAANKQFTSGRPLVSADKERLLPELRYEQYTSETAKQLAKVIGYVPLVKDIGPSADPLASPTVVENYVRGWTGTMGGLALKISDAGLRAAGIGNQHTKPEESIADYPFFDSFVSRYPSMKNQNLTDFYANKKAADEVMNSLKMSGKQADLDTYNRINSQHTELNLDGIGNAIGKAKQTLDAVQFRSDIPPVEKRQLMDTLIYQIGSMAKMGNSMADEYKKAAKVKGN